MGFITDIPCRAITHLPCWLRTERFCNRCLLIFFTFLPDGISVPLYSSHCGRAIRHGYAFCLNCQQTPGGASRCLRFCTLRCVGYYSPLLPPSRSAWPGWRRFTLAWGVAAIAVWMRQTLLPTFAAEQTYLEEWRRRGLLPWRANNSPTLQYPCVSKPWIQRSLPSFGRLRRCRLSL